MATQTKTKRKRRAVPSKIDGVTQVIPTAENPRKVCPRCGRELSAIYGFYHTNSTLFQEDHRMNLCKDCFTKSILSEDGRIDSGKLKNTLRLTDTPLYWDILESAKNEVQKANPYIKNEDIPYHGKDILKIYMKDVNSLAQLSNKSFADSEEDDYVMNRSSANIDPTKPLDFCVNNSMTIIDEPEAPEVKWSKKDKQNMKYAISMVGYDPFEDVGLSEADRKYCFNILAGYCDTEGVAEDGHKLQGVIEMTMLYCQCRKISEVMNTALNAKKVDEATVQKLSSSKSTLLSSIATIAKDNNIASNYSKEHKQGTNTLTAKMREMQDKGMHNAEVNLFDIKTAEAFKQIDSISMDNISRQLTLDAGDYSDMIKEQTEMIADLTDENDTLREENRKLQNRVFELEGSGKR